MFCSYTKFLRWQKNFLPLKFLSVFIILLFNGVYAFAQGGSQNPDFTITLSGGVYTNGTFSWPYSTRNDGLYGFDIPTKGSGSGAITPHWHWNATDSPPRAITVAYNVKSSFSYSNYPGRSGSGDCSDGFDNKNKCIVGTSGSSNYTKYIVVDDPGSDLDLPPFSPSSGISGMPYTAGVSIGVKVSAKIITIASGTRCQFWPSGEAPGNIKEASWKIGGQAVLSYPNSAWPLTSSVPSLVDWDSTHFSDDSVITFEITGKSKSLLPDGRNIQFEYKDLALTYNKAMYIQFPFDPQTYNEAMSRVVNHITINNPLSADKKSILSGVTGIPKATVYYSDAHGTNNPVHLIGDTLGSFLQGDVANGFDHFLMSNEILNSVQSKNRWQPKINLAFLLNCRAAYPLDFASSFIPNNLETDVCFVGSPLRTLVTQSSDDYVRIVFQDLALGKTLSDSMIHAQNIFPIEVMDDNGNTFSQPLDTYGDSSMKLHGVYGGINPVDWFKLLQ